MALFVVGVEASQVGADCYLDPVKRVGVGRILVHQPRVRDAARIQEADMPNEVWIALDELLVVLIVHDEHVVSPGQVLAGDLNSPVLGEVVATLRRDPGHGGMSTFADVPVVGSARAASRSTEGWTDPRRRITASAVGDRQMFPAHTTRTRRVRRESAALSSFTCTS